MGKCVRICRKVYLSSLTIFSLFALKNYKIPKLKSVSFQMKKFVFFINPQKRKFPQII